MFHSTPFQSLRWMEHFIFCLMIIFILINIHYLYKSWKCKEERCTTKFSIDRMCQVLGHPHLTVKLLICKTTSDMFRTIWAFNTRELIMSNCFAKQRYRVLKIFSRIIQYCFSFCLNGLAMIFACQENPFIIFRSKEIYIYFKTNNKIPINCWNNEEKQGFW